MAKPVLVHQHVDLDACVCVALSGALPDEVHFIPSDAAALPEVCPCCGGMLPIMVRILDHSLGEYGRLDEDGTRHAAALAMPEAQQAHPDVLAEVAESDSQGHLTARRFTLSQIMAALRTGGRYRGLRGAELDREIVAVMSQVVRGLNGLHREQEKSRAYAKRCRIEEVGPNLRVAVIPGGRSNETVNDLLDSEHNVALNIFTDGQNIGVFRHPRRAAPDLRLLAPHLPGWFIHSKGFLAAWGTRKAPKFGPPPAETPQNPDQLLTLLRRVFGEQT